MGFVLQTSSLTSSNLESLFGFRFHLQSHSLLRNKQSQWAWRKERKNKVFISHPLSQGGNSVCLETSLPEVARHLDKVIKSGNSWKKFGCASVIWSFFRFYLVRVSVSVSCTVWAVMYDSQMTFMNCFFLMSL